MKSSIFKTGSTLKCRNPWINVGRNTPGLMWVEIPLDQCGSEYPWINVGRSKVGCPIGIDCFRLRHFIARKCAIIANKKEIKYSRNCEQRNCFAKAFPFKNQ